MPRYVGLVFGVLVAVCAVAKCSALPIAIANPSFESGVNADVADWTDGESGAQSGHNVTEANPLATSGDNVANLRGYHSATANSGIFQVLGDTILAGAYTISFDAESSNASSTDVFAGLFNTVPGDYLGGAVISLPAADASLKSYSVSVVVPNGSPAIGNPLGLQFINAGTSSDDDAMDPLNGDFAGNGAAGNRLLLDNVAIDYAPSVPEPACVLLLIASAGAAYVGRRLV
ncbi:hypothetical protein Pla175_14020 [Pirellulimonas nuda]|uniref:PEP-CTERM protein-sorting domain-containing protein n=1 Tax=Pirellulimonas nuda TaxID=2528009 RepID=A0A518D989_9BACT|nr:hypothetical protein [Pirellulimonas nuda]QDU88032.1 hypothetical protein Pla175_14020 [Pirellulimonas nuda]